MIEDNISGLFCERNALSIKEKIEKLMYNKDLYDKISINIGNISKEWALKAISQWECFFDEVLSIE